MAEASAPPLYEQYVLGIDNQQPPLSMNATSAVHPPNLNICVAETSLIHTTKLHCLHRKTRKVTKYRHSAFVWAFLLFCFACCHPCAIIPFCSDAYKIQEVYCLQCKQKISSVPNPAKHAHVCLLLIFLVGFGFVIFVVYQSVSMRLASGNGFYQQ